jgi:hypothetical protein
VVRATEANAKAVKILMVGRGLTEEQAFQKSYLFLVQVRRFLVKSREAKPKGHPDICVERRDLAARYPRYASLNSGCAA